MPKNIVICSDGTGNSAVKDRGTNVFKMFESIDLNGHKRDPQLDPQIAFYDDGVGTEDFKPLRILGGVAGVGLGRNVRFLYKQLTRVYDVGDRIYLFGFSRGAFTVRTLAGLITRCGLIDGSKLQTSQELNYAVDQVYKVYRKSYQTEISKRLFGPSKLDELTAFRKANCLASRIPIHFIGVWDTVDAVGLPFAIGDIINGLIYRFKFSDKHLHEDVAYACQALAIDDERQSFTPVLWELNHEKNDETRIKQVWFAGAHSNVGGGYPKQGMSLVALEWMMREAQLRGLRLIKGDHVFCASHANGDDKLYDPRAGLGVFYRWYVRDISALCNKHKITVPNVHVSVLERIAHGTEDYAPGNIPANSQVVITTTGVPSEDQAALKRASAVQKVLHIAYGKRGIKKSLLNHVKMSMNIGWFSYWIYLATCFLVLLTSASSEGIKVLIHPWLAMYDIYQLTTQLIGSPPFSVVMERVGALGNQIWPIVVILTLGFSVSYVLMIMCDIRMNREFSKFWHDVQPHLRQALKIARLGKVVRSLSPNPNTEMAKKNDL